MIDYDPLHKTKELILPNYAKPEHHITKLKEHFDKFVMWTADKSRVELINKCFEKESEQFHGFTVIDIFYTHPEGEGMIKSECRIPGITLSQETGFIIYPFAKDLFTGQVYTITDYFADRIENTQAIKEWESMRASQPSLEHTVARPYPYIFGIDELNRFRFKINKFSNGTTQDYFCFIVPKSTLQFPVKPEMFDTLTPDIKNLEIRDEIVAVPDPRIDQIANSIRDIPIGKTMKKSYKKR